ncbi:Uu.00g017420.m01.CDS01 [Anthostomella pinea]|uniref:Uu.00g017420.m01.CDS01 n=1 Tax=Anthostomella pinea TaxID=933095 RepID=A0AAI8YQI9_9PEZI|nr:Uu.00g017420.m01.CDS01 [Anthostomella pinea]
MAPWSSSVELDVEPMDETKLELMDMSVNGLKVDALLDALLAELEDNELRVLLDVEAQVNNGVDEVERDAKSASKDNLALLNNVELDVISQLIGCVDTALEADSLVKTSEWPEIAELLAGNQVKGPTDGSSWAHKAPTCS